MTRIAGGSRISAVTISFRDFLSIDETRDKEREDIPRRETSVKRRRERRDKGRLRLFRASRAGSHQRLRTASRVQDAFPRRAVPSARREGRLQTEVALHLRFLFY